MALVVDGCGCFPTGRHYPGIAHLLRVTVRGASDEFAAETPFSEVPIALLDVETTGRDPVTDRIVELGIVVGLRGAVVRRHDWLINPERPIAEDAKAVHGISDDDVKDAPTFAAVAGEILEALRGTLPGAYNAPFDKAFLFAELERAQIETTLQRKVEWVDPLIWARELQSEERSPRPRRRGGPARHQAGKRPPRLRRRRGRTACTLQARFGRPGASSVRRLHPRTAPALAQTSRRTPPLALELTERRGS